MNDQSRRSRDHDEQRTAERDDLEALPPWGTVLAVVAHPDDATFALGATLAQWTAHGASVHVLTLTRGAPSTPGISGDLTGYATTQLRQVAGQLGLGSARMLDFPADDLAEVAVGRLRAAVADEVGRLRPDGLLVFDASGVSGHPDHVRATEIALEVATDHDLPVLAWTVPARLAEELNAACETDFHGRPSEELDAVVRVDRESQLITSLTHASQAVPLHRLWRRLELLGDREYFVWLRRPHDPH